MASKPLRVGFVPEHFSTPLHFAKQHHSLSAELIPFPSGTGHMITALRSGEIDIGVGLTEGWVAGLGKLPQPNEPSDGGYRLIGTYVETPLCWAISTGANRTEIDSVDALKGGKIGVSRIGSGSYVMGYVLADERCWLAPTSGVGTGNEMGSPFSDFVVLNTFENLRRAVNEGEADFFMWEHFTSKRYYDSGEIRKVGEIYTPWSSWMIVASTSLIHEGEEGKDARMDPRVDEFLDKVNLGIKHFNEHKDEAVKYISTELDYTEEDARAWLETVRFPERTQGVDLEVISKTVDTLYKAGVLIEGKGMGPEAMIAKQR
jgi:ABC-type nitrate/sulfonate/bicarbonate transport system substrate-binding protein